MMIILLSILQMLLLLLLAPLVAGFIKKVKACLQNRRGPSVLQVYYDVLKLLAKDSVTSPTVSWIFRMAHYLYFATALVAAALVPVWGYTGGSFNDLFVLIYLLAAGRFFMALASLDAGSAFGGMGSSREMFISVLVEPVLLLSLLTVSVRTGSTNLSSMAGSVTTSTLSLPSVFAAIAFFIVMIAETGRVPVDNPDTHLELTMIHEGMVLEYSGRHLGLIFLAAALKQVVVILLFAILFIPWQMPGGMVPVAGMVWLVVKVLLSALSLAAVETSTNKMRLFKVPNFLAVSGLLALMALVTQ